MEKQYENSLEENVNTTERFDSQAGAINVHPGCIQGVWGIGLTFLGPAILGYSLASGGIQHPIFGTAMALAPGPALCCYAVKINIPSKTKRDVKLSDRIKQTTAFTSVFVGAEALSFGVGYGLGCLMR